MARIPFDELGDCKVLRRFDSKAADELADLASADHDLALAGTAIEQLRKSAQPVRGIGRVVPFDVVAAALMDSAAIRYRRAVEDGSGRKGNEWFESKLGPSLLAVHKELMKLADQHVAHAARHQEASFALVGLTSGDPSTASVAWVNAVVRSLYVTNLDRLAEYSRLVVAAKEAVNVAMTGARMAVEAELRVLSGEELLALPVAGTEAEDPPKRKRHGSRD